MFTIRPKPRADMAGTTALLAWKAADRLTASTWSHFSSGKSASGATCWMPALFTRISTGPSVRAAVSIRARTSDGQAMSAPQKAMVRPDASAIRRRAASISSGSPRPLSITWQPAAARASAMACPMPDVEPVTTALRPFMCVSFRLEDGCGHDHARPFKNGRCGGVRCHCGGGSLSLPDVPRGAPLCGAQGIAAAGRSWQTLQQGACQRPFGTEGSALPRPGAPGSADAPRAPSSFRDSRAGRFAEIRLEWQHLLLCLVRPQK